jgi:glycosyltransferase involved in cell wall biosynthesis
MLTLNKALTIGTNCIFNKFEWKSFGVDLYANVLDANGMAHIAKVIHKALVEIETPYTVSQFTSLTKFLMPNRYPINIILGGAENSMIVPIFNNIPETEYTIGVWFWELEDYFPWGEAYDYVDEVWCFSQFCKDIFKKYDHKGIPIHKFVYAPETNIADSCSLHKIHNMYGINPHKYTFLYTFDYFGSIDRKNPLGTIDAFRMAFGDSDDVQLIIKTMSGGGFAHDKAFFERYINGMKNVIYIDEDMDKSTYIGLINACDCYVSLHRSEGLGIGMIEAMYLGKPVIATAYGGSMEFTNPDCTLLVNYTMQHTMTNLCYYSPSATWAEPNIQKAASYMQLLVNNRQCGQMIGKRAQEHIYTNFNQAILNKQINTRLQWIKKSLE